MTAAQKVVVIVGLLVFVLVLLFPPYYYIDPRDEIFFRALGLRAASELRFIPLWKHAAGYVPGAQELDFALWVGMMGVVASATAVLCWLVGQSGWWERELFGAKKT